jgi:hypothetical protein
LHAVPQNKSTYLKILIWNWKINIWIQIKVFFVVLSKKFELNMSSK